MLAVWDGGGLMFYIISGFIIQRQLRSDGIVFVPIKETKPNQGMISLSYVCGDPMNLPQDSLHTLSITNHMDSLWCPSVQSPPPLKLLFTSHIQSTFPLFLDTLSHLTYICTPTHPANNTHT